MEEKQSIAACGAGSISKRVRPGERMKRCENVKDVALYIQKIDEMIERKQKLFADFWALLDSLKVQEMVESTSNFGERERLEAAEQRMDQDIIHKGV